MVRLLRSLPSSVLQPSALAAPVMLALVAAIGGCGSMPSIPHGRGSERAMWVTRFDYESKSDVERIVRDCKSAGFTTLLFQVRGNATAGYRSSYEPWAEQLGGVDPGFDPLAVAIEAGRAAGLRVCAWVNVMPAWWGSEPPTDPAQLVNAHPEWLWVDQHGARQPYSDKFYVSVNPCLPEVRRYLTLVMRDLVGRYAVDGLHLDYIRFPNEQPPGEPDRSGLDYPRDKATLSLFLGETGKTPEQDRAAWDAWRTEQVTNLVRDIRYVVRQTRPSVELSAAVGPVPEQARHHFQDVKTWLEENLLDVVYPMNYTRDPKVFAERIAAWRRFADGHPVVMGVNIDPGDIEVAREELGMALQAFNGFAVFAYSSMFDSTNTSIAKQDQATRFQRQQRRKALMPVLQDLARGGPG